MIKYRNEHLPLFRNVPWSWISHMSQLCGLFCYCKANWDVMITSTRNTSHDLPDQKMTMPCLVSVQHFIEQTQKIMKFMDLQTDRQTLREILCKEKKQMCVDNAQCTRWYQCWEVQSNLGSRMPRIMNNSVYEQIFRTQSVSDDVLCLKLQTRKLSTSWSDKLGVSLSAVRGGTQK